MDLRVGELTHSAMYTTRKIERLFLLFDFTRNLKNIFNAFVNKDQMNVPTNGHELIPGINAWLLLHALSDCMLWKKEKL